MYIYQDFWLRRLSRCAGALLESRHYENDKSFFSSTLFFPSSFSFKNVCNVQENNMKGQISGPIYKLTYKI